MKKSIGRTIITSAILGLLLTSCGTNTGQQSQTEAGQPPFAPAPAKTTRAATPATQESTPTAPSGYETTQKTAGTGEYSVYIDGKYYNCSELLGGNSGATCGKDLSTAFERWGENIDTYANSGRLGPLGNGGANSLLSYENVAYLGLYACLINQNGYTSKEFVDYAKTLHDDPDPNGTGVSFLPFWSEAGRSLCPDLAFRE